MNELSIKEMKIQCALGTLKKNTFLYRPGGVEKQNYITITAVADDIEGCNRLVGTYINTLVVINGRLVPRWDQTKTLSREVWVAWDKVHKHGSILIQYDGERVTDSDSPRDVETILHRD